MLRGRGRESGRLLSTLVICQGGKELSEDVRSWITSYIAGILLPSFSRSFSRRRRRRETVSSRLSGFKGSEGSPVQWESPVRRYEMRRRRDSRSSIVAPATASLSRVIFLILREALVSCVLGGC